MPLTDAALVIAANALDAAATHASLHSSSPGATGANQVGTRVAINLTVDSAGDLSATGIEFSGLPANQPVSHVGLWTAASGGTFLGAFALTGDTTASSLGEYEVTTLTIDSTTT